MNRKPYNVMLKFAVMPPSIKIVCETCDARAEWDKKLEELESWDFKTEQGKTVEKVVVR